MPSLPAWPEASGPRILTLVGNDLTIDVRARKTASSLARAGFSVISIGVDNVGTVPVEESLDGASLYRVTPSLDPRITTRTIRFSRPEIRDWLRYRVEIQRQRLQMARRHLTAWRHLSRERVLGSEHRGLIGKNVYSLEKRIRTYRVIVCQLRYMTLNNLYKLAARPPRRAWAHGSWRRDLPELHRYEAVIGPLVDLLQPELVHVHDIFHLGLAARAAARSAEGGRTMRVVYDAHEYVAGLPVDPIRRRAYAQLESEYIGRADAVVTVSDGLGRLLFERYGVKADIVMNAPDLETGVEVESLRSVLQLGETQRLLVYIGGVAAHRGLKEAIQALSLLDDDVHLAVVAASGTGYVMELLDLARELHVDSRVHLAPYVVPEAVVSYLRGANASLIPLSRAVENYEVALPNKLFQSIHAHVPVAVSDNPEMARFVTELGVGSVFVASQPATIAQAVRFILQNPDRYKRVFADREVMQRLTWRAQTETLERVYGRLGASGR